MVQSGKLAVPEPQPAPEPEEEDDWIATEEPPQPRPEPRSIYTAIPGKEHACCYGPCRDEDV